MMDRIVHIVIGILLGLIGVAIVAGALAVMVLAKSVTIAGVVLAVIGVLLVFWGGLIIPNSGVEDGARKLTILVGPFLPLIPGGRRREDPPLPPTGGAL